MARAGAHALGMPAPHPRRRRALPRRRGRGLHRRLPRRPHAQPVRDLQRPGALPRARATRRRWSGPGCLATGHYARIARGPGGEPLVSRAADAGQGSELHAGHARSRRARADHLPPGRPPEGPRAGDRPGGRPARRRRPSRARRSASSARAATRRSWSAAAAWSRASGRSRTAPAACWGRTAATGASRSASARASAWRARSRSTSSRPTPRATRWSSDRASAWPRTSVALDPARIHADLDDEILDVRVRYRGRALRGRARADGGRVDVELLDPADGVAPGQTAALYRRGRLVAAGTIAPRGPRHRRSS